ncbi:MAG: FKBP-type peptidyl-prolyl cis-trans isomerase [Saprospiraceae bacterium]|nr:FKBP-type peptidyl-prolyl cis-trans isomerase [Saprospiraceae bacterium]
MDKFSYSIGILIAKSFSEQGIDSLNYEDFLKGIKDQMNGKSTMTVDEATQSYSNAMKEVSSSKHNANKEAGEKFLAENRSKPGVITTPSGLQYQVINMGTGSKPGPTSKVKVHYHGTLPDGKVFDSSVQRGEPISFPLNGVIPGWTEGVQLMPVGSKFKFFIPYNLAYGERGAGADIKPFSALVFEVELLGIEN